MGIGARSGSWFVVVVALGAALGAALLPAPRALAIRLPGCDANGTVSAAAQANICNKCKESAKRKLKDPALRKLVSDCTCNEKTNDWDRLPDPSTDPEKPDPIDQDIDKMNCFWLGEESNPGRAFMAGRDGQLYFFADVLCQELRDPRDRAFVDFNSGNLCTHEVLHNVLDARGIPAESPGREPQHECLGAYTWMPSKLEMFAAGANATGGAWSNLCYQTGGCNNYCRAKDCITFKDPTGVGHCPAGSPCQGQQAASYDFCHWGWSTPDPESKAICDQAVRKYNTGVRGCP